jgi:hypothetical protein
MNFMGATILKKSDLPASTKKLSPKMKKLREKLLNGPVMSSEQVKEYEKFHPWLKKIKD